MLPELKQYLAKVGWYSRLDPKAEKEVVRELQTHFEDEIDELCETGLTTAEAADVARKRFGVAESLGREWHEVYSKGSWNQAFLAASPHFLIALTFSLHLWRNNFWLIAIALALLIVTTYAWHRGQPSWSFPWLGYFLIPLFIVSLSVTVAVGREISAFALKNNMEWIIILVYIPVALWLLGYILVKAMRRDWLFASFMLFPFPVIALWLFVLELNVGLVAYGKDGFGGSDQGIAWTFLALGFAAGAFIRLRQRMLKVGVLALAPLLILAMVWRFAGIDFNPVLALFISLSLSGFILSPALLRSQVAHGYNRVRAWDESWLGRAAKRT